MALTPFGLPSLATITKALKDQRKYCLPKWDTQNFLDPHHNKQIDKIFNKYLIAHVNRKDINI
jgi:hypothetical protein